MSWRTAGQAARWLLSFAALSIAGLAAAAGPAESKVDIPHVAERIEDVSRIEGLMRAFYEVVNVRPSEPRQWGRDRTLYAPWIRFVATSNAADGRPQVEVWNHQQLVDGSEPLANRGFREREIHRKLRTYGHIAHVDSTYETEYDSPSGLRRGRGVNSIEMYFDGRRWWISSVMWMTEAPSAPIPAELLPAPGRP